MQAKPQQTPLEALPESWQQYIKRLRSEAEDTRHKLKLVRLSDRQKTETIADLTKQYQTVERERDELRRQLSAIQQ